MATSTTDTTSPAADAAGAPDAAPDGAGTETLADDSADSTSDTIEATRRSRDRAKARARDAEARADALAARVKALEAAAESSAAAHTTLTGRLDALLNSRREYLAAKYVDPSMQKAAAIVLSTIVDLDDERAVAQQLQSMGLVRTRSTPAAPGGTSTEPTRGYSTPI